MRIVAKYDFNGGKSVVEQDYEEDYRKIIAAINAVDASSYKTKECKEKGKKYGKLLYSPQQINACFKTQFSIHKWGSCKTPVRYDDIGMQPDNYDHPKIKKSSREIDFITSNKLGIEVQFGKYAFMAYDICMKMPIFHNMGLIDVGVEIVPVKKLVDEMSTGVSYFEQIAWDLHHRGTSNIGIPVLVLGIDA